MSVKKEKGTIGIDDAKKMLEEEMKSRTQNCLNEIDSVLKKYNCRIEHSITILSNSTVIPQMRVIPNTEGQ